MGSGLRASGLVLTSCQSATGLKIAGILALLVFAGKLRSARLSPSPSTWLSFAGPGLRDTLSIAPGIVA